MVILIVGPAGAGKSTVSVTLSKRFKKCALIEVDDVRHMIKEGHVSPFEENEESKNQLKLGVINTISLTKNYVKYGFDVIIDDVVSATERLDLYFKNLEKLELKIFLLLPDEETVRKRDLDREERVQMKDNASILYKRFQRLVQSEDRWTVIDSSRHTVEETVQSILAKI